ncbi:MAG TPA: hypothetical protein VI756_23525 [Blastocatellia bacterium]
MQKLDRLGWTAGIALTSQGVRIGVRANRADAIERVTRQLPAGWTFAKSPIVDVMYSISAHDNLPGSRVQRFNLLYAGIQRLARTTDFNELMKAFEDDLHVTVAATTPRRIFFKAGVVAWKGRAILVAGPESCGKTTLVNALVEAGAIYYSDEYAVMDRKGLLHPYPVRMSVERSAHLQPEARVKLGTRPLNIGTILLSQYKPRAVFKPVEASPGEAVLTLLGICFTPMKNPEATLSLLASVASTATVLKGNRGEAGDAARKILSGL